MPSTAATDGILAPQRRALTVGLVLLVTLVAFEALAVGTVMPDVARELGGIALYGWVFSAFFLANLVGITIAGSVLDRGRLATSLLVGLVLFAAGLVVGGLAPTMEVLVAGRVLQGLGAGFEAPVAYTAIGRAYPDVLRPRMFATMSTAWVVPGLVGPAIAGLVGQEVGWRPVFLGLLPLIAVAAAMTVPPLRRLVPDSAPGGEAPLVAATTTGPASAVARSGFRARAALALAIAAGAGLLMGGLGSGSLMPGAALIGIGAAIAVPAFARLVPPGTLRAVPVMPAAILLRGILTFGFFAVDAYVPLALVSVRGLDLAAAGLALTVATVTWTAGSWIQQRFVVRRGARLFVGLGFATVAAGIAGTSLVLVGEMPVAIGMAAWGVAGLGMGLAYAPLTFTVLREAPAGGQGRASSSLQLSDVLGTALGSGVGGALIALAAGPAALAGAAGPGHAAATAPALADPAALATGIAMAFAVGGLAALAGLGLSGRLSRRAPAGPAGL